MNMQSIKGYSAIDNGRNYVLRFNNKKGGERMQAYCVKCRAKKDMNNPQAITMKNGKPATQGTCPSCGTKMFRIGKA